MPDSRLACRLMVLVLLLAPIGEALAETPASSLYVRRVKTHVRALELIEGGAKRRQSDAVLLVFDATTFSPPPKLNEFRLVQDFRGEIIPWLDALETRQASENIYLATTLSGSPIRLGEPGWRVAIEKHLRREWWAEKGFPGFEPATGWMARLVSKVPGPSRTLGFISGELVPERLADATRDRNTRFLPKESWRKKLLPVGEYWNEEAVGSCLVKRQTVLDVVAPEVRFCDFWPVQELPEVPWVTRPHIAVNRDGSQRPPPQRFYANSAIGQTLCGNFVFFNTDAPSGFGYWPFARAATITNGRYIFYPFTPSEFLDACPYDPILMKYLAPESGSKREILSSKAGDVALSALIDATRLVISKTPWSDGPPRAKSWMELASVKPVALESRHRPRDKPFTWVGTAFLTPGAAESHGKEIAKILPLYDSAITIMKGVQTDIAAGRVERPHRRSRANLRLSIYWFEMSAFHLHALSLYLAEIRDHIPEARRKKMTEYAVIFQRAIRMSDCLHGYEGRSIDQERDRELQANGVNSPSSPQGNILPLLETDPEFRALRHPGEVLKNLDPRLLGRALRMIDAAQEVMRHEARSPWGWVVYYSEAFTYTWFGVPPVLSGGRRPDSDDPEGVPPRARRPTRAARVQGSRAGGVQQGPGL